MDEKEFLRLFNSQKVATIAKVERAIVDKNLEYDGVIRQLQIFTKNIASLNNRLKDQKEYWQSRKSVEWFAGVKGYELSEEEIERIVAKISEDKE